MSEDLHAPSGPDGRSLLERRFPALQRLGAIARPRALVLVQQATTADCGAACLAMVLAYHGRHVPLDVLRSSMGEEVSALAILESARRQGLRGRAVQADLDELELLPKGAILHWNFDHFVVLESLGRKRVMILDPALGRRRVPLAEFSRSFTGVALLLEPSEAFEPAARETSMVQRHLVRVLEHRGLWVRALWMSVLVQVLALAVPLVTTMIVDRVIPHRDHDLLVVLLAGAGMMTVFGFLSSLVRANLLVQLRTLLDARMTLGFLDHMVSLPYAFFQRRSAGDLMLRLGSNGTVREILTSGVMSAVLDGTMVCLYLVLVIWTSPTMGVVVTLIACAQLVLYIVTRKRQRELMSEGLAAQAKTSSYEVELLSGIEALKSMGAEHRAVDRWSNLFVDSLNVSLRRGRLDAWVASLLGMSSTAAPLIILAVGTKLVLGGNLSLGTMLGLTALAGGFLAPFGALVHAILQFQLLGSYLERIDDVVSTEPEQRLADVRPAPPLSGAIRAERIAFRYRPSAPFAVEDVSVDIRPGQFVAIVGPSGAGKSTLAKLLVGLYVPEHGHVFYDDHDLAALDLRSLRAQLGVVTQRGELFGLSVRENIALGHPELDLEGVIAAAKRAQIHDDIASLPLGYDTILADGGASLSGGQRQRLALARALAGDPAILLLDEATSALDHVTEAAVQHSLAELRCTRIVIAHRLGTIIEADLILVMDRGRVVATGTHAALLETSPVYRKLYERVRA